MKLTEDQYKLVADALSMSKAFAIYGDGREEHRKAIEEVEKIFNLEFTRDYVPF